MNKQQLAAKIWESANKMRSKIDASEYKDYILGFMFYKFLSDKELKFLKDKGFTEEDIKQLNEEDIETVKFVQNGVGYFMSYKNLFSTWIEKGSDFDVSHVRDALSAFDRLISPTHKKVFDRIFNTLQTGLSRLGGSTGEQTKSIRDLIHLLDEIPMSAKQDYDVLGFIYEYLISNFAVNAGKKAGEFYTPHEVSLLMSEIVADHLKEKEEIKIYDPTSGSGSLLINIGRSIGKHMINENKIKYYAQELKENTYNLTRMNLVMRGILPDNIVTRNADTLADDWPYFDESDPVGTYDPLYVDSVVSNPPYSQKWDRTDKESDPRYSDFGLAPKSKADYAFLLHDLYHVKPNGIMTIVLPHGVLFRGGEEAEIRKNLIEKNHVDAIIGLPANIFFGTGIPTIVMVLKQNRENTDVLIVDASKGYIKDGNKNKLQVSDIKKIVDTVIHRENIEKYSRKVNLEEIRENEYNLNIPRYVDSSEESESWDLFSLMHGGIPKTELEKLNDFWDELPSLKEDLFNEIDTKHVEIAVENIKQTINNNSDVLNYIDKYNKHVHELKDFLNNRLIENMTSLHINSEEQVIGKKIFEELEDFKLIDKYKAYQALDDEWNSTSIDLEIIQTEGFEATKKVDPNMVTKKKNNKEVEVQDGWVGRIIPFKIAQEIKLTVQLNSLKSKEERLIEIEAKYQELIEELQEEEKDVLLNDDNTSFLVTKVNEALDDVFEDVETEQTIILQEYYDLLENRAKKNEREAFIESHPEFEWDKMDPNKDKTYGKSAVRSFMQELKSTVMFEEDSYEFKVKLVHSLLEEEKELKKAIKSETAELHILTKDTIEDLSDKEVIELLKVKWIDTLIDSLVKLPINVLRTLSNEVQDLKEKYDVTFSDISNKIEKEQNSLLELIGDLDGDEFDMKGLSELKSLLSGD
jgi:type I restriction enzyme M protein